MAPVCMDSDHGLHLFSVNRFDAGQVRLASIVHVLSYCAVVLRDGTKAALRTARSQRAERGFLTDISLGVASGSSNQHRGAC